MIVKLKEFDYNVTIHIGVNAGSKMEVFEMLSDVLEAVDEFPNDVVCRSVGELM